METKIDIILLIDNNYVKSPIYKSVNLTKEEWDNLETKQKVEILLSYFVKNSNFVDILKNGSSLL